MVPHLMNHVSVYFRSVASQGLEPRIQEPESYVLPITPRGNNSLARLKLRKGTKKYIPSKLFASFLLPVCNLLAPYS